MSEIKKRLPFVSATDEEISVLDSAILDDQEQEQVVQSLKVENDASNKQILLFSRVVVGCSVVLHTLYIFRQVNPLDPFLSPAQPPRIPLDTLFASLHLLALSAMVALPSVNNLREGTYVPTPYHVVYGTTALAPAFCVISGQGLTNTIWWCFALATALLHISQLERMKYDARGA
ncbi:hypothetical protein BC834DRAFT_904011 [Gloeopeniophorella convolvens]|nr:hypothetical protein BC834DRAFT_904011 [Gloeopeniophorella convolvens]